MRRLPIYFLIDVSESMVGEPIEQVQAGMETIVKELRSDPYALETVYLSIIAFAGRAMKVSSMTELYNFYPPKLPIGGGTSLGVALGYLMNDIDASIKKTTLEEKGDWKPIIFLFTDGNPTDRVTEAFDRWNKKYRTSTNLIAISLGNHMDTNLLTQISDNVLRLNSTDPTSFKEFFKWVTASIKTSSVSINDLNTDELKLAPATDDLLSKIEMEMSAPDIVDNYIVAMLGKCQNKLRPYLIKYEKQGGDSPYSAYVSNNQKGYRLVGAYPIDNSYFELSDGKPLGATINTRELYGFPTCPCCGNQYGFSVCQCGRIICVGDEPKSTCPWCGIQAAFGFSESDSDITRTRG